MRRILLENVRNVWKIIVLNNVWSVRYRVYKSTISLEIIYIRSILNKKSDRVVWLGTGGGVSPKNMYGKDFLSHWSCRFLSAGLWNSWGLKRLSICRWPCCYFSVSHQDVLNVLHHLPCFPCTSTEVPKTH